MGKTGQSVGEMNGWYARLFKIVLVTIIPIHGWIAVEIISLKTFQAVTESNRFTDRDAEIMVDEIDDKLTAHEVIDGHPVMVERVQKIQHTLEDVKSGVSNNHDALIRIESKLK